MAGARLFRALPLRSLAACRPRQNIIRSMATPCNSQLSIIERELRIVARLPVTLASSESACIGVYVLVAYFVAGFVFVPAERIAVLVATYNKSHFDSNI